MNVFQRSLPQLSKTLDYDQAAPLGYLLLQKALFSVFGMTDPSTRALPLFFGVLTIPLAIIVFRRVFPLQISPCALILSVGLVCLNRGLVNYSAVSKQYTLECCVTLLLIYLFHQPLAGWCLSQSDRRFSQSRWLVVLSPILLWFSYGAVFILAGFGVALLFRAWRSREKHLRQLSAWFTLSAVLNLAVFFHYSARAAMTNQRLASMWSEAYLPLWPPAASFVWLCKALTAAGEFVIHQRLSYLVPIALLFTLLFALRHRSWFWIGCSASLCACLAASALRKYPFSGRLIMFLLPILILMLANLIDWLYPRWKQLSIAATAVILLAAAVGLSLGTLRHYDSIDKVREAHRQILAGFKPGDTLWIAPYSQACFHYYSRQYPFAPGAQIHFLRLDEHPAPAPGGNWLLVMRTPANPGEGEGLLTYFSRFAKPVRSFDGELTSARLFVVHSPPSR